MSQIVNTLPALPDDLPYDNYFLYHIGSSDTYRCSNFDYFISNTLDSNNSIYYHNRIAYDYDSSSDSWVVNNHLSDGHSFFDGSFQLIASTVDIYNSDGTLYCSATKRDYFTNTISLISSSITSSTLTSALNDTKLVFPILVVALICCIAFRKAWRFFRGCIKGA